MKTIIRSALALAALLPIAACDGDSTGSGRFSGTMDFQYSGAWSGSFHAESEGLPRDFETGSAVFGQRTTGAADGPAAYIFAQQDGPGTLVDNLIFSVENPAVGTVSCAAGNNDCPFGAILVLGDDGASEDDDADAILLSTDGTLTITSITDKRIRGTFQFTMGNLFEDEDSVTRISSGTFDVPVLSSADGFGGSLSRLSRASR